MAYDEKKQVSQRAHNVIMEGRKRLSVSGVEEVESFDEAEIVMFTSGGELVVRGAGLHIDRLDLENGDLSVSGTISDLSYEEAAQTTSLWSRLFK